MEPKVKYSVASGAITVVLGALAIFLLANLESVRKVHAGTQYLVILRSISLMLASRMKARAVRLRFS